MLSFVLAAPVDAVGKLIIGLAPLVVFLVFVLVLIVGGKRKANQRPPARPKSGGPKFSERPRSTPPPARPQPVRNDEIKDFLRRAAGQRKEQAANQAETARKEASKSTLQPFVARSSAQLRDTTPKAPADDIIVADAVREPSLSQGVAARLSTRQFDERAAQLSDDLARADLKREMHLKQKFGNQVGRLADTGLAPGERSTDNAAEVQTGANNWSIVLTPESARQAFLLTEIFNRPVDRW
jgi:hypothetical protein